MKKILFIWAVLFCLGTTAYSAPSAASNDGNVLTEGVHQYTGTITMIALDGTATVYTGRTVQAEVIGDKVNYTIARLPLAVASLRVEIPDITVDPVTGDIPQQNEIRVVALLVALRGNVYGNTQTDRTCDLVFDVEAAQGFVRFEFTGTSTN